MLAAIYRASRASLSQRHWESHQPQEEPHSRYLPHLQATQENPASPSRRNPASSEVLGGEVLVPSQRRDRRLRAAGQRCAQQAAVRALSGRRHWLAPVLLCTGWPRRGQGLRAQTDASSWGPAACPHLPLSGCSRTAGGGAFLPLPRRLRCGDTDDLTEHPSGSAGELRSAEGVTAGWGLCPPSRFGWGLGRSVLEILAIGAKAGGLQRACPRWSPGSVLPVGAG